MSLRAGGGRPLKYVFIEEDGSILWARLMSAIFGGAWLAVLTGVTNTILTTLQSAAGLYSALGGFLAALIRGLLGVPGAGFNEGYAQLSAYITGMGPFAFVVSIISVLVLYRTVEWVMTNVV